MTNCENVGPVNCCCEWEMRDQFRRRASRKRQLLYKVYPFKKNLLHAVPSHKRAPAFYFPVGCYTIKSWILKLVVFPSQRVNKDFKSFDWDFFVNLTSAPKGRAGKMSVSKRSTGNALLMHARSCVRTSVCVCVCVFVCVCAHTCMWLLVYCQSVCVCVNLLYELSIPENK